jgi:hypothetical protein
MEKFKAGDRVFMLKDGKPMYGTVKWYNHNDVPVVAWETDLWTYAVSESQLSLMADGKK